MADIPLYGYNAAQYVIPAQFQSYGGFTITMLNDLIPKINSRLPVTLTQEEYDALDPPDPTILYVIIDPL